MPEALPIEPLSRPFDVTLSDLPGSKSLTNRALLLAALAEGTGTLTNVLFADDTRVMMGALRALGYELAIEESSRRVRVTGGPILAADADLHLGNAGTAYRFLTAACSLGKGLYRLDGVERMRQRPIGQLVEALHEIGGEVRYLDKPGFPPLEIHGRGLRGGELEMPATLSSQYISALLMVGPLCQKGLTIRFRETVTSEPYVRMTLGLMWRFGVRADADASLQRVTVEPAHYAACAYAVEPDASNASYFLAAAAVIPGSRCVIEGLGQRSLQGDVGFADVLHRMGASLAFGGDFITVMSPPTGQRLRGIDVDLGAMPDMAQTLAVVALFADGPTTIRNIGNLRIKETDRLAALRNELTKLGAAVRITGDDLTVMPPPDGKLKPARIDTYDDHRMAMSFAVAGLRSAGIIINDPGCVSKTFPEYFDFLRRFGSSVC